MNSYVFGAILLLAIAANCATGGQQEQHPELSKLVRNWAQKLGGELWHFGELVTRRSKVIDSFKSTSVVKEDGEQLLKDIHEKIFIMMREKVEAVKRIMDIAEQVAQAQKDDDIKYDFQYYNVKNLTNQTMPNMSASTQEIKEEEELPEPQELRFEGPVMSVERYQAMVQPEEDGYQQDQDQESPEVVETKDEDLEADLEVTDGPEKDPQASQTPPKDKTKLLLLENKHFYNIPVNTNHSAVHVPSNVFDRSKDVISGIIWSEKLDETFRDNYKRDPTLSWQYFGSSTGFMRQFPAMIWSQEPIDLFDCRMRSWFIEAASSPKDVIILVDRSGSMTGMRREIARHVVHNILDTLGNNDYVNIFTFSNTTEPLVECFDNQLVQANLANVRVLKDNMGNFKTEQIANFSLALITAFELLQDYRESSKGANCNQAIMLVTDGVQYNYKEIFERYNWGNLPFMNVRVFTYLIGREVSDVREVKWMACANQGYYVHLSTYAEVREEVLQYIPVMARPMVLNPNQKPNPAWSPVYADVTDPKLTNWLWVNRERNRQRERFLAYRRNKTFLPSDEQDRKFVHQQKPKPDTSEMQTYHLMTSVSLPVYDKKPRANITEKIQVNEAIWITVTREERVAILLGVAGTDVPIEYIQRLMMAYRLGVNGYGFIVTNNGYVLIHPDLRPVFQGILKPAYNRVDITELEILDDLTNPREFSDKIREFRKNIIMQKKGNITLQIKSHLDDMKRVYLGLRHYYYMGINDTPFSIVISLPKKYGLYRIQHHIENDIHRIRSNDKIKNAFNFSQFFTGNWTIHPEWHYCRDLDDTHQYESPEQEFLYFLKKMEGPGWKWTSECDRKLISNLVADAKITTWFGENITTTTKEENGTEFIRRFGITVAFLSTHSGLTRWQSFPQNIEANLMDPYFRHFHVLHNKAVDEIWYRRAVDHHFVDHSSFVYSVPFDIGDENNTLVTVSHAIFKEDSGKKAPAAVVGYQFYHTALYALFKKITNSCGDMHCKRTCESGELHCLMLDDNGYVVVSDNQQETGYFFGKVRPDIMSQLIEEEIYKLIRMYDYQGLCPEGQETTNPAPRLLTPFSHVLHVLERIVYYLFMLASTTQFRQTLTSLYTTEKEYEQYYKIVEEQLKYAPCDLDSLLYRLNYDKVVSGEQQPIILGNCSSILVHQVFNSSLILVVIDDQALWECSFNETTSYPYFYDEYEVLSYQHPLACILENHATRLERNNGLFTCYKTEYFNPALHLDNVAKWAFSTLIWFAKTIFGNELVETMVYAETSDQVNDQERHEPPAETVEEEAEEESDQTADQPPSSRNEKEFDQRLLITKTKPVPCDYEIFLYSLVHYTDRNISNSGYNKTMKDCTRPFIVQRVSGSNMIFLVINNLCREDTEKPYPIIEPQKVDYNMTLSCYRALHNDFPRRHYMTCINRNANESDIKLCGTGTKLPNNALALAALFYCISKLLLI